MKKQIRMNVWETNSSSTHAICIAKDREYVLPPYTLTFGHGEFGWENDTEYDTAAYLHEMIHEIYYNDKEKQDEVKNQIAETLNLYGIDSEWEEDKFYEWSDGFTTYDSGNIDHGSACKELLDLLLADDEMLMTFLFGDSFVITGNDNGYDFNNRMHEVKEIVHSSWGDYKEYEDEYKEEFNNYDIYIKGN